MENSRDECDSKEGTADERVSDCKDRPAEDIQTKRADGKNGWKGQGGGSTGRNGAPWAGPTHSELESGRGKSECDRCEFYRDNNRIFQN